MKMDDWEIKKWTRRTISHDHNYHKDCNIFSCPKCSTKVRSKEALKEHIERYSDLENCKLTKNIKCKDCQRLYLDFSGFFFHQKSGSCKAVKPCQKCDKTFTTASAWTTHLKYSKSCGSVLQRNIECENCHKIFVHEKSLTIHQKKYCDQRRQFKEKLLCEVCGKMGFKNRYKLRLHICSHTQDVVCKKCGAKFSQIGQLRRHEQETCMGDKVCDVCGKKGFRNKKEFSRHIILEHNQTFKLESLNLDYKCDNCGLGFCRQSSVNDHVKHSCGHGIICEHCGKADFKSKMEFRKHLNVDHNSSNVIEPDLQGLICHICFRSFNSQAAKDKHLASVHKGLKNPETGNFDYFFACEQCSEVLTSMEELQSHKKALHSRYNKIPCKVCEKLIVIKQMREHMRGAHTDELHYKCESCGKKFKWCTNLSYHRKKQKCSGTTHHKTNRKVKT